MRLINNNVAKKTIKTFDRKFQKFRISNKNDLFFISRKGEINTHA